MEDQGEIALMFEKCGEEIKIVGYTLPRKGEIFQSGEVRNVFLAQSMENPIFEDSERELLSKYLDSGIFPARANSQEVVEDIRSVYKYKPVALKTRPVIQELPAEFRIKHEIIGVLIHMKTRQCYKGYATSLFRYWSVSNLP